MNFYEVAPLTLSDIIASIAIVGILLTAIYFIERERKRDAKRSAREIAERLRRYDERKALEKQIEELKANQNHG